MPDLQFVLGRHVLWRPQDAPMPAGVVPLHHLREHVHELQGFGGGQIAIQAFFEGAVEPFDDRGFGIPVGRGEWRVFSRPVETGDCKILCHDPFAIDADDADAPVSGDVPKLGPRNGRSCL